MTGISGTLDTRRMGRDKLCLLNPVTFYLEGIGELLVPSGFVFDGGSIPRFAWSLVGCPFRGPGDYGYLAHDYLYHLADKNQPVCKRVEADNAMLELHLYCGMDSITAHGIYTVVRGASWAFWGDGAPDVPTSAFDMQEIWD